MPLYEYKCEQCGQSYDRIERASEPKDGTCPECGAVAHRLIGNPALQFKGSGWYVNDYGKGNGNGSRPTEKETETAKEAAGESTTKPKTEAKKTENKTEKLKSDAKVA